MKDKGLHVLEELVKAKETAQIEMLWETYLIDKIKKGPIGPLGLQNPERMAQPEFPSIVELGLIGDFICR